VIGAVAGVGVISGAVILLRAGKMKRSGGTDSLDTGLYKKLDEGSSKNEIGKELSSLVEMLDRGLLTREEFEVAKQKVLMT
jgi:hypothetical protein